MRCTLKSVLICLPLISFVNGDAIGDAISLSTLVMDSANTIINSFNGTAYLNTSSLVMTVVHAVGAVDANLSTFNASSTTVNTTTMDTAYLNYIDALGSMAGAVESRGRLFHSETNLPVYQALQGLASIVHTYGTDLTSRHLISQDSTIRTLTSGSDIVEAQAAWANNANYPGKRSVVWDEEH